MSLQSYKKSESKLHHKVKLHLDIDIYTGGFVLHIFTHIKVRQLGYTRLLLFFIAKGSSFILPILGGMTFSGKSSLSLLQFVTNSNFKLELDELSPTLFKATFTSKMKYRFKHVKPRLKQR